MFTLKMITELEYPSRQSGVKNHELCDKKAPFQEGLRVFLGVLGTVKERTLDLQEN